MEMTVMLDRRRAVSFSMAAVVLAIAGNDSSKASERDNLLSDAITRSRTVASFAAGLLFVQNLPLGLNRRIERGFKRANMLPYRPFTRGRCMEPIRTDAPTTNETAERRQAEFFAWLALRVIAPRALRAAGYEALAVGCERQQHLRDGRAAALAQHTIGREHRSRLLVGLSRTAYGTSAHASTCSFYATHEQIETVVEAGYFCARALVETMCRDDLERIDAAFSVRLAVAAIDQAHEIGSTSWAAAI